MGVSQHCGLSQITERCLGRARTTDRGPIHEATLAPEARLLAYRLRRSFGTLSAIILLSVCGCSDPVLVPANLAGPVLTFPVSVGTNWQIAIYDLGGAGTSVLPGITADGEPGVAWAPDGTELAIAETATENRQARLGVRILDKEGFLARGIIFGPEYPVVPNSASWSPDGRTLAVAGGGGVVLVDASSLEATAFFADLARHQVSATAWAPDGSQVIVTQTNGTPRLFTSTLSELPLPSPLDTLSQVQGAAWSPNGDLFITTNTDGLIVSGSEVTALSVSEERRLCPSWDSSGNTLSFIEGGLATRIVTLTPGGATQDVPAPSAGTRIGCPSWRPS